MPRTSKSVADHQAQRHDRYDERLGTQRSLDPGYESIFTTERNCTTNESLSQRDSHPRYNDRRYKLTKDDQYKIPTNNNIEQPLPNRDEARHQ